MMIASEDGGMAPPSGTDGGMSHESHDAHLDLGRTIFFTGDATGHACGCKAGQAGQAHLGRGFITVDS